MFKSSFTMPSLSLQDTFEKRSREASVEPTTRPAERYCPDEDEEESKDGESLDNSELGHPTSGNEEDDDDDIA